MKQPRRTIYVKWGNPLEGYWCVLSPTDLTRPFRRKVDAVRCARQIVATYNLKVKVGKKGRKK